jgi:hypothetical protein
MATYPLESSWDHGDEHDGEERGEGPCVGESVEHRLVAAVSVGAGVADGVAVHRGEVPWH